MRANVEVNVLINESALSFLSIDSAAEAIGKQFRFGGSNLGQRVSCGQYRRSSA